jgi:class 3 adenylate cyclase
LQAKTAPRLVAFTGGDSLIGLDQTLDEVAKWLTALGLAQYTKHFVENDIDPSIIIGLTDWDLKEIGVSSLGHRRKLLRAVTEFKRTRAAQTADTSEHSPRLAINHADVDGRPGPVPSFVVAEPQAAAGERRQLTLMFCALVAPMALSSRVDPEELREIVGGYHRRCAEVITKFGGFVAKFMGEDVLAYFGYPQAHEDDAERAVRTGLAVVEGASQFDLRVRVGIATGLVVVGELIGEGAAQEHMVVGDTPNLAARLRTLAKPDTVVIDGGTRRLLGELFEYCALGAVPVKGFSHCLPIWQVTGASDVDSRFEALRTDSTALVGREEEVELLMRRWAQAKCAEGTVVLISGEPGIGKSRVTQTVLERLTGEPHTRLRYFCSPQHQDTALHPIITHIERAAGFRREDTSAQRLDRLEALLFQASNDLDKAAPLLADLLSVPTGDRYPPLDLSPQKRKERTLEALLAQIEGLAGRQPVLAVFEDAHWIDPSSQELLELIVDRVTALPVLLIITFRPEFSPPWVGHPQVTLLSLSRLPRRQRAQMISRITRGKQLPQEVAEQIVDRTDGVPLFIEELTKAVLESGMLREVEDRYLVTGPLPPLAIPATLHASLLARLDRLAPVRELAQVAAALGRQFSHELISAVVALPQQQLDVALARLVSAELIFRRGAPPNAEYTFKHALIQDAAYHSLLKSTRVEIHARIAQALEKGFPARAASEPELLAHHYTEASEFMLAAPYWLKAGQLALGRMALVESITHLDRGLALLGKTPISRDREQLELQIRTALGTAWWARKGWMAEEMVEALRPASDLAKSLQQPAALIQVLWGLRVHYLIRGRLRESSVLAKRALVVATETDRQDLVLIAKMGALITHFWIGELREAAEFGKAILANYDDQRHRPIADQFNHDPKTVSGSYGQHVLWMLGYPEQALELARRTDEHARRRNHPFDLAFALTLGAHIHDYLSDGSALRMRGEEAERIGAERGLSTFEIMGQAVQGVALVRAGKPKLAVPVLRESMDRWHAAGASLWGRYINAVLAEALALSGFLEEGINLCDRVLMEIEQPDCGERSHYSEILRLRGWMLSLRGDISGAEQNYLASLDWARQQQAKSWELRAGTSYARLMQSQGRVKEALDLLKPVYDWFTEGFETPDLKKAKAVLEGLH